MLSQQRHRRHHQQSAPPSCQSAIAVSRMDTVWFSSSSSSSPFLHSMPTDRNRANAIQKDKSSVEMHKLFDAVCLALLISISTGQSDQSRRKTGIDMYFEQLKKPGAEIPSESLEVGREGRLLREAVMSGDSEGIRRMLDAGVVNVNDVNSAGWTALHVASADGRAEMMELLIEMGANVEATDTEGHTPLHFAVSCNRKMCVDRHSIVSLLIERGAGVNKADSTKRTPLHTAASRGHTQACRTLLKNMIDVGKPHSQLLDAVEKEGRSALHLAAAGGHLETVEKLLEWGADHSIKCKQGKTALDNADSHAEVSDVLKKHTPIAHSRSVEKIVGNETAKFAESESEGEPHLDDISYPGKAAKVM